MIFKKLKNAKDCLQTQLWDDDDEFLFFSCIFLMRVGGSYNVCVCVADRMYRGLYGKMCT